VISNKETMQPTKKSEKANASPSVGRGGLMVSALDSAPSGFEPWPGTVFFCKTLDSYSASLHPAVQMVPANLMLWVTLRWTSIPSKGSRNNSGRFMLQNIIKPDRPEMFSFRLSVQSLCNEKTNESKGSLHDQTGTSLFFSLIV